MENQDGPVCAAQRCNHKEPRLTRFRRARRAKLKPPLASQFDETGNGPADLPWSTNDHIRHLIQVGTDKTMTSKFSVDDFADMITGIDLHCPSYTWYWSCDKALARIASVLMYMMATNCSDAAGSFETSKEAEQFNDIFFFAPSHMVELCMKWNMFRPYVVIVAIEYISRLVEMKKILVTHQNLRLLFLVAVVVAAKFVDDEQHHFDNVAYTRVLPIQLGVLNKLERTFLQLIEFNVVVADDRVRRLRADLIVMVQAFLESILRRT